MPVLHGFWVAQPRALRSPSGDLTAAPELSIMMWSSFYKWGNWNSKSLALSHVGKDEYRFLWGEQFCLPHTWTHATPTWAMAAGQYIRAFSTRES